MGWLSVTHSPAGTTRPDRRWWGTPPVRLYQPPPFPATDPRARGPIPVAATFGSDGPSRRVPTQAVAASMGLQLVSNAEEENDVLVSVRDPVFLAVRVHGLLVLLGGLVVGLEGSYPHPMCRGPVALRRPGLAFLLAHHAPCGKLWRILATLDYGPHSHLPIVRSAPPDTRCLWLLANATAMTES